MAENEKLLSNLSAAKASKLADKQQGAEIGKRLAVCLMLLCLVDQSFVGIGDRDKAKKQCGGKSDIEA